jgi:hypothetical protein
VARVEKNRNIYRVTATKINARYLLEELDGSIILKCISEKQDGKVWTGLIRLFHKTRGNFLTYGKITRANQ